MQRDRLWTLPNIVSLSRLGLAAGFVLVEDIPWRLALVGVATTSDYVDGWLARRREEFSRLGALIDAGTDRAFVLTAVAALAWDGALSSIEAGVFLSRDLVTAVAFMITRYVPAYRNITFVARFPGKVVTVLQLITLAVAIVAPRRIDPLIVVLGIASAIAIADYIRAFRNVRAK